MSRAPEILLQESISATVEQHVRYAYVDAAALVSRAAAETFAMYTRLHTKCIHCIPSSGLCILGLDTASVNDADATAGSLGCNYDCIVSTRKAAYG
jgi:hypothetical protein